MNLEYKGFTFEQPLWLDLLVDDVLILELKSVERVLPIHKAQLLSYMKLLNKPVGLLINFDERILATESPQVASQRGTSENEPSRLISS